MSPMQIDAAAAAATTMSMSCTAEKAALSAGEAHTTLAMVSLAAPAHAPAARLPLEVVAVVDRSGSMGGEKMATMKQTLGFLVTKGLQSGDSLSIVAFDDTVDTRLPMTTMDGKGKTEATKAIEALQPGRTTNLSGGLLQGIDVLQRAPAPAGGSTRAILLFTDGMANVGIRDGPGILHAAQGAMANSPMTIFTFGFGSDHNEDMLRSLADTTNGLYYYLDKVETIPQAFADCLGGLVAVVAQNATLVLTPAPGASIAHVHASYKQTRAVGAGDGAESVELSLGDIYAEDEKDVIFRLALPALPAPLEGGGAAALRATLRYFSVPASRLETVAAELSVARPALAPTEQPVNLRLEEQRVRVAAAEAMAQAAQLADQGRLAEGRAMLNKCRMETLASPAAPTPQCSAVLDDLQRVETGYRDQDEYRAWGGKMTKMSMASHAQQRSNHTTGGVYEKGAKRASKMAWFGK